MTKRPEWKKTLQPLTTPPKSYPLAAFDIEGVGGPGGFVSAGLLAGDDYQLFDSANALVEGLKTRDLKGYRIAAHNLGYDFGIIEPFLGAKDFALLINGRPFKVTIQSGRKNPRYLVDSLLFAAGLPLAAVGDKLGFPKGETPIELKQLDNSTSRAQRRTLFQRPDIQEYLKRDVEIGLAYMTTFQDMINELGGEMRFTLASTAMDLFRRRFLSQEYRTPFQTRNDYARQAYYGGRVEPYRLGPWDNLNVYDINSLYPYVQYHYEYPDPDTLVGPLDVTDKRHIYKYEGVSEVTIHVPKMHIPPLPFRTAEKLYFPVGTFKAHYTHIELRRAEQLGCKILDVHSTLYAERTCSPFKDYVSTLYRLRQEMKANADPRELVVKILLNSLYGKFGQRSDSGLREIKSILWWLEHPNPPPVEFRTIDEFETVLVPISYGEQPSYVNTLWAAYITAYARLTLLDYMLLVEDQLFYCDTDSLFIRGELPTSPELGAMKQEYDNVMVEIFGPKAYFITKDQTIIKEKCKGVPRANRLEFLLAGETTFTRPIGLLEAGVMNRHRTFDFAYPSQWIEVVKREHQHNPKRQPLILYPHSLERYLTVAHRAERLPM